jgi:hypothetical protein
MKFCHFNIHTEFASLCGGIACECVNYVINHKKCITLSALLDTTFGIKLKPNSMPLLTVLLVIIAAGVILWVVNSYIPMQSTLKRILNIVVVLIVIVWLLKIFGLFSYLTNITV